MSDVSAIPITADGRLPGLTDSDPPAPPAARAHSAAPLPITVESSDAHAM